MVSPRRCELLSILGNEPNRRSFSARLLGPIHLSLTLALRDEMTSVQTGPFEATFRRLFDPVFDPAFPAPIDKMQKMPSSGSA
jgi:hypothetical protein